LLCHQNFPFLSAARYVDPLYCIRIDGLPSDTTIETLCKEMKANKSGWYAIPTHQSGDTIFAYVRDQRSEKYAREFVKKWHNNTSFRKHYKLKCQIEYERVHVGETMTAVPDQTECNDISLAVDSDTRTDAGEEPGKTLSLNRTGVRPMFFLLAAIYAEHKTNDTSSRETIACNIITTASLIDSEPSGNLSAYFTKD